MFGLLTFCLFVCYPANDPKRKTLSIDLEGEENVLRESVEKLKVVEANRKALVSQLQEALHEQVLGHLYSDFSPPLNLMLCFICRQIITCSIM